MTGLLACFLAFPVVFAGNVLHFGIQSGDLALAGNQLSIECQLDDLSYTVYIYKTPSVDIKTSSHLTFCSSSGCDNVSPKYKFAINSTTVKITILVLKIANDERWWTCQTSTEEKTLSSKRFYLMVYSPPSGVTLNSTSVCDLATSSCTFECITTSCTYPAPSFSWVYSKVNETSTEPLPEIGRKENSSNSNGCSDSKSYFSQTLTIPIYTTFANNVKSTVELQCILDYPISSYNYESYPSCAVSFAVKTSDLAIYDDMTKLVQNNTLHIVEGENKTLSCHSGSSRPPPIITWYIDDEIIKESTDTDLTFLSTTELHDKEVYCTACNFQCQNESVSSSISVLYVEVKIMSVSIEKGNITTIEIIRGQPELISCITSIGRPQATIRWHKFFNGTEITLTDTHKTEIIPNGKGYVETKSFLKLNVTRDDNGWDLHCSAYNVDGMEPLNAVNRIKINVLYGPADVKLQFNGSVLSDSLRVVRGSSISIHCSVTANPPVQTYIWNVGGHTGENLTIKSVDTDQVINCTALNEMISYSGLNKTGSGWRAVRLFTFYYPDTPSNVTVMEVKDGTFNISWVSESDNGLPQSFIIQTRNTTSTAWDDTRYCAYDKGYKATHSIVITVNNLPVFLRMYSQNSFGKSKFTAEMFLIKNIKQALQHDLNVDKIFITNVSLSGLLGLTLTVLFGTCLLKACRRSWRICVGDVWSAETKETKENESLRLNRIYEDMARRESDRMTYEQMAPPLPMRDYRKES